MAHRARKGLLPLVLLAALVGLVGSPLSVRGQEGLITGVVRDVGGAPVEGARVTVTNVETGASSRALTNSSGAFLVPGLEPGTYAASAALLGFHESSRIDEIGRAHV